jgi:CheY-like chemotaxis protein
MSNPPSIMTAHGETMSERPANVLLGEDDPELRSLLADMLRRDGHAVTEAKDGAELLEHVAGTLDDSGELSTVDLIVSDIRMPGWTGMEILENLRHVDCWAPVILITAFGDPDTHEMAGRLGAVAVFDKPFDIDDLRTAVLNALARSPQGPLQG